MYIIYTYIYVYIIYICTCIGVFFSKTEFSWGEFLSKNLFMGKLLGRNLWGGVVVHGGTYDQIMSREGELYKCIFQ